MNKILRFILDLFFPNRCPFCNNFILWNVFACDKCIDALSYVDEDLCNRCGKSPCICETALYYDKCYVACYYEGLARQGIINLKFKNAINTAEFFADILSTKILSDGIKFDAIIPVPMSRKKQSIRGYNQAEEIAKCISNHLQIPVNNKILYTNESNVEQHNLNASQRAENVKMKYLINNHLKFTGKTVLLCDDVITTSSTVNECAKCLRKIGVNTIVLAIGATTKLNLVEP